MKADRAVVSFTSRPYCSRGGSRAGLEALEERNVAFLCRESNCDLSVVQPPGAYSPYGLLNHEIEGSKV